MPLAPRTTSMPHLLGGTERLDGRECLGGTERLDGRECLGAPTHHLNDVR